MLTLTEMRYWCYRFKTEADGGASSKGAPEGLKEAFEESVAFQRTSGWKLFADQWDLHENAFGEPTIIPRDQSIWDEWIDECKTLAGKLPMDTKERTIKLERPATIQHKEISVVLTRE
jgi:hypothetical protein